VIISIIWTLPSSTPSARDPIPANRSQLRFVTRSMIHWTRPLLPMYATVSSKSPWSTSSTYNIRDLDTVEKRAWRRK